MSQKLSTLPVAGALTGAELALLTQAGDSKSATLNVISAFIQSRVGAGVSAFTTTTANFTQPAIGSTVSVNVANTSWMAVGQIVYVYQAGYYAVSSITDSTHVLLQNIGYPGNATAATNILSGAQVSPGGLLGPSAAVTPETYGAAGDGVTDDTTALTNWLTALNSLGWSYGALKQNATYLISNKIDVTSGSFSLIGNNATIKMANGTAVDGNHYMLRFTGDNFIVSNLVVDGNRANRAPANVAAHLFYIWTGASDFIFENCRAINAVCDGFYVGTFTPTVLSSFPTRGQFNNCHTDNAYRNGMSITNGADITVFGGSYDNSNGTAPQAGIDLEPNAGTGSPALKNIKVIGVSATGNQGNGFSTVNVGSPVDIFLDDIVCDGTGSSGSRGINFAAPGTRVGTVILRNYTALTNVDNLVTLSTSRISIGKLVIENCSGTSDHVVVSGSNVGGDIDLIRAYNVVAGPLVQFSNPTDFWIKHLSIDSCGQTVASADNALFNATGAPVASGILSAYVTNSTGYIGGGTGSFTLKNVYMTGITCGSTGHAQGAVQPGGNWNLDNITVLNPTAGSVSGAGYGIRALSALASVNNLNVSGYNAGRNISLVNPPEATVSASTALGATSKLVIFTGTTAGQTITLPASTLFSEQQAQTITIINSSTQSLTVAPGGSDTIVGTTTIAAGASLKFAADVKAAKWYSH